MYDFDFALVAEGKTDHAVLKNILLGYCKARQQPREPRITRSHPDEESEFGGWPLTLSFLTDKCYIDALQLSENLIVHVDSDALQNEGLIASPMLPDGSIDVLALVPSIHQLLRQKIGDDDCRKYGDRFIFAIAVREIECWILPLWAENLADKTVGCTAALNNTVSKKGEKYFKTYRGYDEMSAKYRKKNFLLDEGPKNPSLKIFLEELDRRTITLPPDD